MLDLHAVSAMFIEPPMRRFGRSGDSVEQRISAQERSVRVKLYRSPGQWILTARSTLRGVQLDGILWHGKGCQVIGRGIVLRSGEPTLSRKRLICLLITIQRVRYNIGWHLHGFLPFKSIPHEPIYAKH